jgi:homoprotocatechuate degradation regulator HpaR
MASKKAGEGRTLPMREFSRSLPMSLLRAREAVMRQFRPSLRNHGLTEQQWRILRALTAVDTIEVTELARVAFLLGPSLSRILRDLEARELIERRAAEVDLRRGVVSISSKGLKLIEAVAPTSEAIYAEITSRYGARKLTELQDMLSELERSLAGMGVADELGAEADE